jgi:non-homologous end joining protein Ku
MRTTLLHQGEEALERSELVHGFQIRKGEYVSFTTKELKRSSLERDRHIAVHSDGGG